MLGYITPDKPEMKVKEYELYSAYYCGICKAIKHRHGELPRLVLSYDSVLLALILSSQLGPGGAGTAAATVKMERCIVHPVKKRAIVYDDPAMDYAADMLVLLAYYKFQDDWADEKKVSGALGMGAFNRLHKKITGYYPETCDIIRRSITELSRLEKENCQSMDEAAEPFATLMQVVFSGSNLVADPDKRQLLGEIGYNIGKWIYLIDAMDDLPKDLEKNRYNPLKTIRDQENFKQRVEFSLICALENATLAAQKLGIETNKGIIENILYFGLFKKTESIVDLEPPMNQEEKGHEE